MSEFEIFSTVLGFLTVGSSFGTLIVRICSRKSK